MNKVIVTLTGPSASGKSTMETLLCKDGAVFEKVVSHTTRPIRRGEADGCDYYFVDQGLFDKIERNGLFAETVKFAGNSYGAHAEEFESIFAQDKIAVVVVEPIGKQAIEAFAEKHGIICMSVFVTNPAVVRYERLLHRFIAEIEQLVLHGPESQKVVTKFAQRLAVVGSVESEWDKLGWAYTIDFANFGPDNTAAVLNTVRAYAMNRLTTSDPEIYLQRSVA